MSQRVVAIHQPEYLCPLSLLDKARRADVLVLLDDVQFNRGSQQHRAKIAPPPVAYRQQASFVWLTIPFVHCHPQFIRDVQVADPSWAVRHRYMIDGIYSAAPGFAAAWPVLDALLCNPPATIAEIATASMRILFETFGVAPGWAVTSTEVGGEGARGARVLDLCQRLRATRYLSGRSGAAYLDRTAFAAAGIEIEVQQFAVPRYREGQPDVPGLSALDAWMHLGERAKEILCSQ